MKKLKTPVLLCCLLASAFGVNAQKVTVTKGSQCPIDLVKQATPVNLMINGDHYFISKFFDHAMMNYHMESFDSKGALLSKGNMDINLGTFNNTYGIDDIVVLGNKGYAMVEHLDKAAGKNTLLARAFDNKGKISDAGEVEVMSIPFEKIMNSGFNNSANSNDRKTLAVVGEMPFVKEQPAQFKIALYDQDLKKTKEGTINLPGENTKNKAMSIAVANDGTVYLIKKGMTKKGEITLSVYQWSATAPADVKEYTLALPDPQQFLDFTYVVNDNNELIVSGMYYERHTLNAGETQTIGVYYFNNKGKSENVFKTFKLDASVSNLATRKLLLNGNTIFLCGEQYKAERIAPPPAAAGSMAAFDYNYDYTHKSEFVIAMDVDGNKKFQLEIQKDAKARDFDAQFYSAYYICNGKLTVVYNDQAGKYIKNYSDMYYAGQIPVLVQITNDGLMQPAVIFKESLKLDNYYVLYPAMSMQDSDNQISFLGGNNESFKYISFKID